MNDRQVNDRQVRQALIDAVWRAADRLDEVRSVTIAGSFGAGAGLEGIADVDTIVVVDRLDAGRFAAMQAAFRAELEPILAARGYALRINPTLGPLKFNDPHTAVLHLMIYTVATHREHAIKSPFTCLDWQRSPLWHKSALQRVYPVFGLQPRHFIHARRGARDYLRDLAEGVVSYREFDFRGGACREIGCKKAMTGRDRHEFAYHVMRFLMQNFLKLVTRRNETAEGEALLAAYFERLPDGAGDFGPLYRELLRRKTECDFERPVADLIERVSRFVATFEEQFREAFERRAVRHLVFRHAPTSLNRAAGEATVFQGRTDPELPGEEPRGLVALAEAARRHRAERVYVSPLRRAVGTLRWLAGHVPGLPDPIEDTRLLEIDYGACEGRSVAEAKRQHPDLFAAWARGDDPPFPGGENTGSVLDRVRAFADERWTADSAPSLACTHNVVLRALVGDRLAVPPADWYRLTIPHLAPIAVVATERFGRFVEFDEEVEREVFSGFFRP